MPTKRQPNPGRRLRAAQFAGDRMLDDLYRPLAAQAERAALRRRRGGERMTERDRQAIVAEVGLMLDNLTPAAVAAIAAAMGLAERAATEGETA